jgi:endonuclease-3
MPKRLTKAARITAILDALENQHPDAKLALDYSSPFELLVALILAAQCTDAKVNELTPGLFHRYPAAGDFAAAPRADLEEEIRSTGFYRQKAKTLQACCEALVSKHDGTVPSDLGALLELPGVGRKTANILRGNAFGIPGIGVDTHVGRLAQRLGWSVETIPDKIERDLTALVPVERQIRTCHLLQYHGRRTCTARKPKCPTCPVESLCHFEAKAPVAAPPPTSRRSRWIGKPDGPAARKPAGAQKKRR